MSPQITPFIWFDADPREVRDHYFSIFDDTAEVFEMPGPDGPMGIAISIDGNPYILFNGGPAHPQTPAFSLMISADGQDEVDRYWNGLLADGGREDQCGWLQDKYGVSWQVVPTVLPEVLGGPDAEGRARATQAMMGMKKLVIADLQAAYDGTSDPAN